MGMESKIKVDCKRIEKAVEEILLAVGEDIKREGLKGTPIRVAKMYSELLAGMHEDPKKHLRSNQTNRLHRSIRLLMLTISLKIKARRRLLSMKI